jgi:hypothetical protein
MNGLGLNRPEIKTILKNARIPKAVIETDKTSMKIFAVIKSTVGYRIPMIDKLCREVTSIRRETVRFNNAPEFLLRIYNASPR